MFLQSFFTNHPLLITSEALAMITNASGGVEMSALKSTSFRKWGQVGRRNACHRASQVATQGVAWLLDVGGSVWKRLHEDPICWKGIAIMGTVLGSRILSWKPRVEEILSPFFRAALLMTSLFFLTSLSELHFRITSITQGNNDLAFCCTLRHYFCTTLFGLLLRGAVAGLGL